MQKRAALLLAAVALAACARPGHGGPAPASAFIPLPVTPHAAALASGSLPRPDGRPGAATLSDGVLSLGSTVIARHVVNATWDGGATAIFYVVEAGGGGAGPAEPALWLYGLCNPNAHQCMPLPDPAPVRVADMTDAALESTGCRAVAFNGGGHLAEANAFGSGRGALVTPTSVPVPPGAQFRITPTMRYVVTRDPSGRLTGYEMDLSDPVPAGGREGYTLETALTAHASEVGSWQGQRFPFSAAHGGRCVWSPPVPEPDCSK